MPVGGNITVNQVNIGEMNALDVAKRVHFLLAAARAREPAGPLIEAKVIEATDAGPKP